MRGYLVLKRAWIGEIGRQDGAWTDRSLQVFSLLTVVVVVAVIVVPVIVVPAIIAAVVIPAATLVYDDLADSTPAVPAVIVTAIDVEKCHRPVTVMYPIVRAYVVSEPLDPDHPRRWPFDHDDPTRLGISVRTTGGR